MVCTERLAIVVDDVHGSERHAVLCAALDGKFLNMSAGHESEYCRGSLADIETRLATAGGPTTVS